MLVLLKDKLPVRKPIRLLPCAARLRLQCLMSWPCQSCLPILPARLLPCAARPRLSIAAPHCSSLARSSSTGKLARVPLKQRTYRPCSKQAAFFRALRTSVRPAASLLALIRRDAAVQHPIEISARLGKCRLCPTQGATQTQTMIGKA